MVARYLDDNPNGSLRDIAGITNERGNVVGLMPHPEHAVEELTGSGTDGLGFFTSLAARPSPDCPTRRSARNGGSTVSRLNPTTSRHFEAPYGALRRSLALGLAAGPRQEAGFITPETGDAHGFLPGPRPR